MHGFRISDKPEPGLVLRFCLDFVGQAQAPHGKTTWCHLTMKHWFIHWKIIIYMSLRCMVLSQALAKIHTISMAILIGKTCILVFYRHIVLSFHRSIYLSIYLTTYQPIQLSSYLRINLSTYLPIYLSTYPLVYLSTCLPTNLSTYWSIYLLPIYLFNGHFRNLNWRHLPYIRLM